MLKRNKSKSDKSTVRPTPAVGPSRSQAWPEGETDIRLDLPSIQDTPLPVQSRQGRSSMMQSTTVKRDPAKPRRISFGQKLGTDSTAEPLATKAKGRATSISLAPKQLHDKENDPQGALAPIASRPSLRHIRATKSTASLSEAEFSRPTRVALPA